VTDNRVRHDDPHQQREILGNHRQNEMPRRRLTGPNGPRTGTGHHDDRDHANRDLTDFEFALAAEQMPRVFDAQVVDQHRAGIVIRFADGSKYGRNRLLFLVLARHTGNGSGADLRNTSSLIHLHIQILHIQRVLLDEFAAGFDVVAHQHPEQLVGAAGVFHPHLQQRAVDGVECRLA
jgi:hypothetical protein